MLRHMCLHMALLSLEPSLLLLFALDQIQALLLAVPANIYPLRRPLQLALVQLLEPLFLLGFLQRLCITDVLLTTVAGLFPQRPRHTPARHVLHHDMMRYRRQPKKPELAFERQQL
jgi:hypothetical protein